MNVVIPTVLPLDHAFLGVGKRGIDWGGHEETEGWFSGAGDWRTSPTGTSGCATEPTLKKCMGSPRVSTGYLAHIIEKEGKQQQQSVTISTLAML